MLILTRKQGEVIMIGDDIRIMVLGTKGNQVRIGIEAPREMDVHREEVYERIKQGLPHPKEAQHGAADTSTD